MTSTTAVRTIAALALILLTGCPPKDNGPGNSGTNNATNNGTNVTTNNDTNNGTNNETTLDYDCDPNLTGEVESDPDVQAAGGPDRYRYEWHSDSDELTLELLDANTSIADLTLSLGGDGTVLDWEAPERSPVADITGTLITADGEQIDLIISKKAYWDGGFREKGPGDLGTIASPVELLSTTVLKLGNDELIVETWEEGPSGDTRGPQVRVAVELDAPPPTVGETHDEVIYEEDGSFHLQRYYLLSPGDVDELSDADFQQFLDEAGVGTFGTSDAVLRLLQTLNDTTWQLRASNHLATCVQGDPIPLLLNAQTPLSCYGSFASFGKGIVSLPACATIVGCLATGISLASATSDMVDCICDDELAGDYITCQGSCNPVTCNNTCYDIRERACSGPVYFEGGCVVEEETSLTGYCLCEFTIGEGGACDRGDPHIRTWDGRGYSPQLPGEFVAARSEKGDFELQVRHRSTDSAVCSVAVVSGAAMRWGEHRVTVLARYRDPNVYVDGVPLAADAGSQAIGDDLVLERRGGSWVLLGPSGYLYIWRNSSRLDVSLALDDPSIDDVEGILGTRNGDPTDDVYDADGTVYSSPTTVTELAEQASSWQVTPAESLFDYAAGESVADFVDPDYIPRLSTVEDLPMDTRDDAAQVCMDAGITDPVSLDNCILDVGCTDDESFIEAHDDVDHIDALEVIDDPFLEGWTEQGEDRGVWDSNPEDTVATQDGTSEAPSFFVSSDDRENFYYRTFIRPDAADDDVVGVVFGYNAPLEANGDSPQMHDMFVFGWKQAAETDPIWGDASEGMYLAHVHGQAASVDEASSLFWDPTTADPAQVDVIATNFGAGTGYTDGADHAVDVYYSSTGIRIDVDGATVFDIAAADLPQPVVPGRFGFFTLSQEARFGITTARAAPGFCDDWDELEEIPCTNRVDSDLTLDGQRMSCPLNINITANLTLVNGSVIEVGDRIFVSNGGSVTATGTPDCPVMITSNEDDPTPGDFRYVSFTGDSLPSRFEHTVFSFGGTSSTTGVLDANTGSSIALNHVTFRDIDGAGARLGGNVTELSDLTFNNVTGPLLRVLPDAVRLIETVGVDAAATDPFIEIFRNETLTMASTWNDHGVPYLISGDLTFEAALEIGAGVELRIGPSGRHWVEQGGSIAAMGTAAEPVIIQSSADTPSPGDWRQFTFDSAADPSEFHYTQISHGGSQGRGAMRVNGAVTLDNVTFTDNETCDVSIGNNGTVDAMSSTYVECP